MRTIPAGGIGQWRRLVLQTSPHGEAFCSTSTIARLLSTSHNAKQSLQPHINSTTGGAKHEARETCRSLPTSNTSRSFNAAYPVTTEKEAQSAGCHPQIRYLPIRDLCGMINIREYRREGMECIVQSRDAAKLMRPYHEDTILDGHDDKCDLSTGDPSITPLSETRRQLEKYLSRLCAGRPWVSKMPEHDAMRRWATGK